MKKWLDEERVLLLRSPPGWGKTSFAVQFAEHLIEAGYSVKYMTAALRDNQPTDETSMNDIWATTIGDTFYQFCKSQEKPFCLIVDEAQIWYPKNAEDGKAELDIFWGEVKTLLKPGQDLVNISTHALVVHQQQQPPPYRQSKCAFFVWLGMVRRALVRLQHLLLSWTLWTL